MRIEEAQAHGLGPVWTKAEGMLYVGIGEQRLYLSPAEASELYERLKAMRSEGWFTEESE